MRKILNSNAFLVLVSTILILAVASILFDEYERNKNLEILNEIVKKEKDLENIKAALEALQKDREEEEENVEAKKDNLSNEIKNSEGDNKENINSEKEEKLTNGDDKMIISRSIDELNNIINENNAQIIDIFHKRERLSKGDREQLKKINNTFSEMLAKHASIYKKISLKKKNSLEMERGDTKEGK